MAGPGFFLLPEKGRYALRNVRAPKCLLTPKLAPLPAAPELVPIDLVIEGSKIGAIVTAGSVDPALGPDLRQSMVLPCLIDCHAHLDKCHIWPRAQNPTGDVQGAVAATTADRTRRWNAEDVERRMQFALETAYAKGVAAIRTHLDSLAPQAKISFPIFRAMRDRWAGRIALQVSSIAPIDIFLDDEGRDLADIVADAGGNLGCGTRIVGRTEGSPHELFERAMTRFFELAEERELAVDLHVDESSDPANFTLNRIARIALKRRFKRPILFGHCCSLALQPDAVIEETLSLCADAGINVVSLPSVNMYLQSRARGATPRWRGVTVLHEMKARGLKVAIAGDNVRDPFFAYGDHDMLETFTQAVRIAHLDHPYADWIASAATVPAAIMGLKDMGVLREGVEANIIVLAARSYSEMLSRSQFDRVVIRSGRAIDTTLPDYRTLDDIVDDDG